MNLPISQIFVAFASLSDAMTYGKNNMIAPEKSDGLFFLGYWGKLWQNRKTAIIGFSIMATSGTSAETIGESAYRKMRSDIIFGRLVPGQKLKLDKLKISYGVSISTLREILSRLASEGLVLAEGQRGFEVPEVSAENLKDIAGLRQLLEGHALAQSFAAGDMEWEGRVVAAHHKLASMERLMQSGDRSQTETWKRYDWEFHQALISACGSHALMETHATVFDKYLRYQMIALSFRGDIAAREHKSLLDCALKRDAETAQHVLADHVSGGVEHALATGTIV